MIGTLPNGLWVETHDHGEDCHDLTITNAIGVGLGLRNLTGWQLQDALVQASAELAGEGTPFTSRFIL